MMETKGTGWVPDYPDLRDITLGHEVVNRLVNQAQGVKQVQGTQVPGSIDSQKDELMTLLRELINIQKINEEDEPKSRLEKHLKKIEDSISSNKLILATAKTTLDELDLPFLMSDKRLKLNSCSREVLQLQKVIEQLGYTCISKIKTDQPDREGHFQKSTELAVRQFQKAVGINQDGIVGWQTKAKLLEERIKNESVINMSSNISDSFDSQQIYQGIITRYWSNQKDFFKHMNQLKEDDSISGIYLDYLKLYCQIKELIDPIIQVIAQIISPLGVHNNLEQALDDGVRIFQRLINESQSKPESKDYQSLIKLIEELLKNKKHESQSMDLEARIAKGDYQQLAQDAIDKYNDKNDSFREKLKDRIRNNIKNFENKHHHSESANKLKGLWEELEKEIPLNKHKKRFSTEKNVGREKSPQNSSAHEASSEREEYWVNVNKYRASLNKVYIEIERNKLEPQSEKQFIQELDNPVLKVPILKTTWDETWKEINEIRATENTDSRKRAKPASSSQNKELENRKLYIALPEFVDLSLGCSSIEDQGSLNSCTAQAGIALIEYFVKKRFKKTLDASPLFLYKVTRNLMHVGGNVGTSIRETMKAMALFGVPPEEYWPYQEHKVDEEPPAFCYGFAQNYQTLTYFRLDYPGISSYVLLPQIKAILVAGFPCAFGFTLYSSIYDELNPRGHIPFPCKDNKSKGGHCVVAVGYDDHKVIKNADGYESVGALLIRNSWGTDWGERGYGWLPYDYVLKGLTADWWSLLQAEWFDTGEFGLGTNDWTSNVGAEEKPGKHTSSGSN